jgi:hypothetical protein
MMLARSGADSDTPSSSGERVLFRNNMEGTGGTIEAFNGPAGWVDVIWDESNQNPKACHLSELVRISS